MEEWVATKDMADAIEEGNEASFDFDDDNGCEFECHLPLRFRLPCKHWMYEEYVKARPLAIGLFHPRWLLDGPPGVTRENPWKMSRERETPSASSRYITGDRYIDHGEQLMVHTLHKAVQKLKSLPAGQKEAFASSFVKGASKLSEQQDKLTLSRVLIPTRLPDALLQSTAPFARNKKRRLTGKELSEQNERDRIRDAKRATREAKAARQEGEEIIQQMRDERTDYRAQFLAHTAEVRAEGSSKGHISR